MGIETGVTLDAESSLVSPESALRVATGINQMPPAARNVIAAASVDVTERRPSDDELIRRVLGGDREAFGVLYRVYFPYIWRYFSRRLDEETAYDLTQDTFIRAFERLSTYSAINADGLRPWLSAIAHHLLIDRKRRERETVCEDELFESQVSPDTTEERALDHCELERIFTFLRGLSPTNQRIVAAHFLDGRKPQEYAPGEGVTVPAAWNRVCRVRKALTRMRDEA